MVVSTTSTSLYELCNYNICHLADRQVEQVVEVGNLLPDVSKSIGRRFDLVAFKTPIVLDCRLTLIGCTYALTSRIVISATRNIHWAIALIRACASLTVPWFHS